MTTAKRSRPGGGTGAAGKSKATDYSHSSGDYRHQAPTADERREQQLLDELRALGYSIAVRCTSCNHPLVASRSVARHLGPVCAAKAKAVAGE